MRQQYIETLRVEDVKKELAEGQRIIRDNQTGISYKNLFGDYLIGATDYKNNRPLHSITLSTSQFHGVLST
jgi:hypothetical protein